MEEAIRLMASGLVRAPRAMRMQAAQARQAHELLDSGGTLGSSSSFPDSVELVSMNQPYTANLSHFGIFCRDLEVMKSFYTGVLICRKPTVVRA